MKQTGDIVVLEHGTSRATILPAAGATVGSLTISGDPVLLPVKLPLATGTWPGGGMPLCFPFAGRVWRDGKVGSYLPSDADSKASQPQMPLEMPLHGFAFSKAWQVESATKASVTMALTDDDSTRAIYPWRFTLRLTFELGGDALTTKLEITCDEILPGARGAAMPVAPGFHPYFAARHPVDRQEGFFSFAYDALEIPALETIAVTPEGNAGPKKLASDTLPVTGGVVKVPLHDEAIHNLIFAGLSGRGARIGGISISWGKDSPWRHVVCWAKPAQHFFCVEPWHGLPDAPHRQHGVVRLGEQARCHFDLAITARR
jgi:galactose mutarotase-like enzyme